MNTDKLVLVIVPVLIIAGAFAYNTFQLDETPIEDTIEETPEEQVEETIPKDNPFNITGGVQPQGNNPGNMTGGFNPRDNNQFNTTENFTPPDGEFNMTDKFPEDRDMQVNTLTEFITGVQQIVDREETTFSILQLVEETRGSLNTTELDEAMLEQIETILDTVEFMVEDGDTVTDIRNYLVELMPTKPN